MWKKITAIGILFIVLLGLTPATRVNAANSGYYIKNYSINVTVKENGVYIIEENIDVYFEISSRGIYRFIPTNYNMKWNVDGEEYFREYEFPISNIKVTGHDVDIEYRSYDVMMRIGNPDKWLIGDQHYKIQYQVHTKDLDVPGMEELFYWNFIGNEWDTTIEHLAINITFEKPVDFQEYSITSGFKGSITNEHMVCEVVKEGVSLSCVSHTGLEAYQGVTLAIELGNDYYVFPTFIKEYMIAVGSSFLVLLYVVYLFLRHGKDDKIVQTIEFSAPKGLNSASVGYIIDDVVQSRDVVSLILEWAKDKYIHIKEEEKADLTLIKLKPIEEPQGTNTAKPFYEINMFNKLFGRNDKVKISSLKYKFASEIATVQSAVKTSFKQKDKKIYTSKSLGLKTLTVFLAPISLALVLGVSIYESSYSIVSTIGVIVVIYIIGALVSALLIYGTKNMQGEKSGLIKKILLAIIVVQIGFFALVMVIDGLQNTYGIYIISSILIMLGIIIFGVFMDKRTDYGLRVYGQVLGLKDFIVKVEKDRLKLLVEENPYIFYDILPYAYAFNLTNVWAKHFKNLEIPEPEYYTSLTNAPFRPNLFINSIDRSMTKTLNTMTSVPPSESSSGGGSFSSSDSGGSSGGGFGGGGGGRW